ncbi:hypothetical protein M3Y98_00927000 [Aphelenchoides besseyi]|nr:hypothetical protein M3Y98_00927000 [Aphelenchoides besseyi]
MEGLENESEEDTKSTMNWEMTLIAIDEKWNRRLTQQTSLLYEQIEHLQKSMTKLSRAMTLDWSYENDGLRYKKFDNLKSWDDAEKKFAVCLTVNSLLSTAKLRIEHETAVNYTNFDEPQEIHGCASIDSSGRWRMKPCDQPRGFICQLDLPFQ